MSDDADMDREAEQVRLARGDHNTEVVAFYEAVDKLCRRFWFIGRAEIIGVLEREQFDLMREWEGASAADDGDEWKKGAPTT